MTTITPINISSFFTFFQIANKQAKIMPLALLHALLLQQSSYGRHAFINDHHWGLSDLVMAVDVFKKVMSKCSDTKRITDMVAKSYSDHCIDTTDARTVHSLVSILSEYAIGKQVCNPSFLDSTVESHCFELRKKISLDNSK